MPEVTAAESVAVVKQETTHEIAAESVAVVKQETTHEIAAESVAVVKQETTHEIAARLEPQPYTVGGISGELDKGDLSVPKLNIVQAVGPLSEDFKPGTILFNKTLTLVPAGDDPKEWSAPLEITVLNARKQFQEVKDFDSEEQGRTVDTMEEVQAAGGWIDWRNDEKPPWRPMLTALCLIKSPNDTVAEQFNIAGSDGHVYELALWVMTGVSYTSAAKQIITASQYSLKNKETGEAELHRGRFVLQVRREKKGANLVYVPRLVLKGKHDEDFVTFAASLL